ncbi:MAG: FtsH protease activity modulator HflK [Anaerolineae bacterium]|nr:FtsH protease activity modulator HflK [Anaerolineae bacterium]
MDDKHQDQTPPVTDQPPPSAGSDNPTGEQPLLNRLSHGLMRLRAAGWRLIRLALSGDGASPTDDFKAALAGLPLRRLAWAGLGLALGVYLLSGIYVVKPGEAGVVRRFGAVIQPRAPEGLNYALPRPFDQVDIVNVSQVRREVVGVLEPEEDHDHPEPPSKLQVLSGDTNIVDFEVVVQYQVNQPADFLFNIDEPVYQLVRDVTRDAVVQLAGRLPVDNILTTDRQRLQEIIRDQIQTSLDSYQSGLVVVNVNLQKAFPPDEVADAFVAVSSAREDRERAINEAQGYANSLLPEARGQAQRVIASANAYRSETVNRAKGAAQAFQTVLAEFEANSRIYGQDITLYRLYLETMEAILPRLGVYVVNPGQEGTVTLRLVNGSGRSGNNLTVDPTTSPALPPGLDNSLSVNPVAPTSSPGSDSQVNP